jgi:hypothetical protein
MALGVCHGEASDSASVALAYEKRLIEQTSDEIRKTLQMSHLSAESARMNEVIVRMSLPPSSFDVSKLRVDYTTEAGKVVPATPGSLNNLFVLRGKLRNNHERFRALIMVFRVSLKDCVRGVCEDMGMAACRAQYVIPIRSEAAVDIPLLFPSHLKLKGTLKAEVEVVASWSQLEPSIEAKEIAESQDRDAQEHELKEAERNKI